MKKLLLLFGIISMCSFSVKAQTLNASPTTVATGGSITLTGNGEGTAGYFENLGTITISPSSSGVTATVSNLTLYNPATGTHTTLTVTLSNSKAQPVTVNLSFPAVVNNDVAGTQNTNFVAFVNQAITVQPAGPASFPNVAESATFTKNSCGVGFIGSKVTYTVPAGKYTASTQAAANQLAQNDINANGQNYANTNGTCTAGYANQAQSGTYTRNNCTVGTIPTSIVYTVPAGTYIAATQAAANQLALNDIAANGQAYANSHGACNAIYARLVLGTSITQTTSGTQVISSKDLTLSFYSDAACTQPLTLTSPLTLSVNEKQVITHGTGTGGNFTLTFTAAAGTNSYDAGDVVIEILDSGAHSTTLYQYTLNNNGTYTPEP